METESKQSTEEKPVEQAATMTITCPHCHKDIETDKLEEIDCCDCDNTFLSIQIKKCRGCDNTYCLSCADINLNQHSFCEDCAEVECNGCDEIYGTEEEDKYKTCSKCGKFYCNQCAKCFLDSANLCIDCSPEDKVTCSSCDNRIIKSNANLCKNFEHCGNAYCNDGRCEGLNENRYCEDCSTFVCSSCEEGFPVENKVLCPSEKCIAKKEYCRNCFEKIKDKSGNCIECSPEEKGNCGVCSRKRYTKLATQCINCRRQYCSNCEELMACTSCRSKVCSKCGSRCTTCQRPYCNECMKFKYGKCKAHQKWWWF